MSALSTPFSQTHYSDRDDLMQAREVVEHLKDLCKTIHVIGMRRLAADDDEVAIRQAWSANLSLEALALQLSDTPIEMLRMRYAVADLNFFIESGTFRSVITGGMDMALATIVDPPLPAAQMS